MIPETHHGGPDYAELARLGLHPEQVLDFSASTNAYGPPPGVREAVISCDLERYPDRNASPLREALAEREGLPPAQVLVGNGAAQLIWTIAAACLRPGAPACVIGPTFCEYARASALARSEVIEWRAEGTPSFAPDLPALRAELVAARPSLVWLCNPNNPTGVYLDAEALDCLVDAAPDALWVLDEAYRPFVDSPWPSTPRIADGRTVLLRSLTKDCALPGLRLGYLLASPGIIAACREALPPWSVSAPAIAAGMAALGSPGHVARTTGLLRAEACRMRAALLACGRYVPPSTTHFLLVDVRDATAVRRHLLAEHAIQVRDCTSFGLPEFIRVAARRPDENDRLLRALEDLRL